MAQTRSSAWRPSARSGFARVYYEEYLQSSCTTWKFGRCHYATSRRPSRAIAACYHLVLLRISQPFSICIPNPKHGPDRASCGAFRSSASSCLSTAPRVSMLSGSDGARCTGLFCVRTAWGRCHLVTCQPVPIQPARDFLDRPVQAFVQPCARHGRARADAPFMRADALELEALASARSTQLAARRSQFPPVPAQHSRQGRSATNTHISDLLERQRPNEVLLVREDEQRRACQSLSSAASKRTQRTKIQAHLLAQQPAQLVPAVAHPHGVARVHDPHDGVGGFKVVAPVRPERPLSAHVPCSELQPLLRSLTGRMYIC